MKALRENLAYLVEEKRIISGISLAFGGADWAQSCLYGRAREVTCRDGAFRGDEAPLGEDAVFDLASVTKLFTGLSILRLREQGRLRLTDEIGRYDRRFSRIAQVRIGELLTFQRALASPERVDGQPDRARALAQLFALEEAPFPEKRFYTDMGAMVLKYVIEAAAEQPYYDYLQKEILGPLGMKNTVARVPEEWLSRTVCYNYERRTLHGDYTVDLDCPAGTVHDYKARLISRDGRDLCGHAGLFSTVSDMTRLAQGMLAGRVVRRETLLEMGTNRTGRPLPNGDYTQYLGMLCFVKHPVQTFSEVPACFGNRTIALNGFTGNHFSVDPERNQFMVILSNRIHNRVTMATGRANPKETLEWLAWPDGQTYPVSQNYVYCRDRYIKGPIGELLAAHQAGETGREEPGR